MSFIGGYQSDVNLNDINFVGDFPIDHSIGGFGVTTGVDDYLLALTPAILQYRPGLPLEVRFSQPNTGAVTINVDGRGIISIKKIVAGVLVNLEAGDLTNDKIYILIYDGVVFQIANSSHLLKEATETHKGISQIATTQEVENGVDNAKIVTPAKLAAYIADKITGLWEDKGLINCAGNPLYPAGQVGDAYTVSVAGKIGGAFGQNVGARDVIYCNTDNAGGDDENVGFAWTLIQSNLEQASEFIAGYARIATQAEVTAGINDAKFITPLKLITWLASQLATELQPGISERATQAEVNAELDDQRHITPLKLINWFITKTATEAIAGIAEIATQAEVTAGVDDTRFVTPQKLAAYVAGKITGLWEDKGTINCAGNPNYPAGLKGDAYTVNVAGRIGGPAGINVEVKDVIYCNTDNPGGTQLAVGASWTIIQANLEQATELLAGYSELATVAEVNAGIDDQRIVTPFKLRVLLDNRLATEILSGLIELATQAEVNAGLDDIRAVTSLKLMTLLNALLKYQAGAGANSIIPKLGVNNTASGSHAAVLNGNNNRANSTFSVAIGSYADAWQFNEYSKAPGAFFATQGSVQHSVLTIWNIVPSGGGIYPINLDGGGASASNRWRIPNNSIIQFMLQFSIVQNSGSAGTIGDTWSAIYEGVAKNVAGVISWVGGAPSAREIRQDAGLSPSVSFGTSGNELIPIVIAIANKNLHVNITGYITQTKFSL